MNLKVDNSPAMIALQRQISVLSIFTQTHKVHKVINFLMGSHCGRFVLHSEILGCEEHVVSSKTKVQSVQLGKTFIFQSKVFVQKGYCFCKSTVSAKLNLN